MADAFTGEIRIFSGNYPPVDWAFCNGQTMLIQQNNILYSIIGNIYGGDGKTNFQLPNLNGSAPLHQGTGVGLTPRTIGETGGTTTVTIDQSSMPNHTHYAQALPAAGSTTDPSSNVWAENVKPGRPPAPQLLYADTATSNMNPLALSAVGGSLPHNNMQPYLPMNFIICLNGEYPLKP